MTETVTLAIVKQLLESQDKAYRATIQLFMEDVRGELKSLRKDLDDVKLSVSFLSKEYDTAKVESKESDSRIHACIDKLTRKINQVEDDTMASVEDMADHASYLENQSRRNNVKIIGVPESSSERTWEDTEKKVKVLIKSELKIEDNIEVERAHRVGKYQSRGRRREDGGYEPPKPRPIVAKISSWKVKESIVKKARAVRPQSIKFVDDFSQQTLAKRNNQIPEMLEARKRGKLAYFIVDKLVIRKTLLAHQYFSLSLQLFILTISTIWNFSLGPYL